VVLYWSTTFWRLEIFSSLSWHSFVSLLTSSVSFAFHSWLFATLSIKPLISRFFTFICLKNPPSSFSRFFLYLDSSMNFSLANYSFCAINSIFLFKSINKLLCFDPDWFNLFIIASFLISYSFTCSNTPSISSRDFCSVTLSSLSLSLLPSKLSIYCVKRSSSLTIAASFCSSVKLRDL